MFLWWWGGERGGRASKSTNCAVSWGVTLSRPTHSGWCGSLEVNRLLAILLYPMLMSCNSFSTHSRYHSSLALTVRWVLHCFMVQHYPVAAIHKCLVILCIWQGWGVLETHTSTLPRLAVMTPYRIGATWMGGLWCLGT